MHRPAAFRRSPSLPLAPALALLGLRAGNDLELDAFPVDEAVFSVPGNDWWLALRGGRPPDQVHVRSIFLDTVARRAPAARGE